TSGTDLHPEGQPEVLQVFVTERTATAKALGLAYNGNEDYAVDDDGNGCGDIFDDNSDDCKVTEAVADGSQKIRIIFDELLEGATVEDFVCACAGASVKPEDCANMIPSALDP